MSGVLDVILTASKVSSGLSNALAFRAVELVSLVPQERVPQRISGQLVEVPVSQILVAIEALQVQVDAISNEIHTSLFPELREQIVKVAQLISHERIQECVVEQPVDVALSPVVLPIKAENTGAVQQPSLQEHIQERIVKQEVAIPQSRFLAIEEELVEASEHIAEQTVSLLVPQIKENHSGCASGSAGAKPRALIQESFPRSVVVVNGKRVNLAVTLRRSCLKRRWVQAREEEDEFLQVVPHRRDRS